MVDKTYFGSRSGPVLHSPSSPNLLPESDRCCSMVLERIALTLYTLCCAGTHSIAIDLITSKVRYSLWFTAALFTSRLCAWLTHAWYANSTNQTVRQTQTSLWEFGRSNHGIMTSGIHPHARRATFSTWHGFQNTRVSQKLQGNIWDCNQRTNS